MTACLLCPSQAVADGLCVADGARLWAAKRWLAQPISALALVGAKAIRPDWQARFDALGELYGHVKAQAFIERLDVARTERKRAEDERIRRRDGAM